MGNLQNKEWTELSKYLVTFKCMIEDAFMDGDMWDNEFILVEASSEDEAIKKFLDIKYEFEPKEVLKAVLFKYMLELLEDDKDDYLGEYIKQEKLNQLNEKIEKDGIDSSIEIEEIMSDVNIKSVSDDFYASLKKGSEKQLYYYGQRYDVFCIKLKTLNALKKDEKKKKENILINMEQKNIDILNAISDVIRAKGVGQEKEYDLDRALLNKFGFKTSEDQSIFTFLNNYILNAIMLDDDKGGFVSYTLIDKTRVIFEKFVNDTEIKQVKSVCIKPSEVFLRLIEKGYNFSDVKSKLAIEVITEYRNKDCN